MVNTQTKKHNIALMMLSMTAIVWGFGFLLSDLLLQNGFAEIPFTLNALRFGSAAIVLAAVFCRRIKVNKQLLLYGCVGGALLFGGFGLQLVGLKYTTPAACGFFTASYALFVPFIVWIFRKKRPSLLVAIGIVSALVGLLIMNVPQQTEKASNNELLGNMLTLGGSLFFAVQIVLADYALKDKKIDPIGLTVTQVAACGILFVVSALIIECKSYPTLSINWNNCWWAITIVSLLGTAFAYFSQTFAQNHLKPAETSIIIACESPIGAVLSVVLGFESFSWQLCVGGFFVLLAVVFVEILPHIVNKKESKQPLPENPNEMDNSTEEHNEE